MRVLGGVSLREHFALRLGELNGCEAEEERSIRTSPWIQPTRQLPCTHPLTPSQTHRHPYHTRRCFTFRLNYRNSNDTSNVSRMSTSCIVPNTVDFTLTTTTGTVRGLGGTWSEPFTPQILWAYWEIRRRHRFHYNQRTGEDRIVLGASCGCRAPGSENLSTRRF